MAAATDLEYGLGDNEAKGVDIEGASRSKIVTGAVAEDTEGADKNGSVEGAEGDEQEEVQVAKKARVEKAENGGTEGLEESGYGLDSFEGEDEKEDPELLNGTVETEDGDGEGEGEEEEEEEDEEDDEEDEGSDVVGDGEDEGTDDVGASGKDAPGDVGLRTLLQEGENTKSSVAKHGADASHMINGAK